MTEKRERGRNVNSGRELKTQEKQKKEKNKRENKDMKKPDE